MNGSAVPQGILRRFTYWYSRLLSWLLVISVAILVIPVSLQIFSRYTAVIPSYIWTEEMARFFFIWTIMIGAMVGIREGSHFEVDIWPKLAARPAALLSLVSSVFVLVFALTFVWWGIEFTRFALNRVSELADLPLWMIHVAWPLAGVTWLLFQGERMWDNLQVLRGSAS